MAKTKDFAQAIRKKLAEDADLAALVEKEAFSAHIASEIFDARECAGLTQAQLADRIGTQQSVIARLESADYDGHSLSMLQRIATALNKKLRVEFYAPTDYSTFVSAERLPTPSWGRALDGWKSKVSVNTTGFEKVA